MTTLRIDSLLLPTDFTRCSEQARAYAGALARRHEATVHILHVIPAAPSYPLVGVSGEQGEVPADTRSQLEAFASDEDLEHLEVTSVIEQHERVAEAILAYADEHEVACIVTGTHGRRGVQRFLMGSEAEGIIRATEHPVWALREREDDTPDRPIDRILVPMDLSGESRTELAHAEALAHDYEAHLDLLHVIEYFPEHDLPGVYGPIVSPLSDRAVSDLEARVKQVLDEKARALDLPDARIETHAVYGRAAPYILDFVDEHETDLVVLTSRGRSGIQRYILGSVAERVLRAAPCPVLILKADGHALVEVPTPEE